MCAYIHTYTPPSGLILRQNDSQDPGKHCPDVLLYCSERNTNENQPKEETPRVRSGRVPDVKLWFPLLEESGHTTLSAHCRGTMHMMWCQPGKLTQVWSVTTQAASMDQTMMDWITGDGALLLAPLSSLQWCQEAKSLKPEGRMGTSEFAASWSEGRVALGTPKLWLVSEVRAVLTYEVW